MSLSKIKSIDISTYDYPLPNEQIALYPLPERNKSRLLIYHPPIIKESTFEYIAEQVSSDALLVFNNSRVIAARLLFKKATGATIEVFCLEPYSPSEYSQSLSTTKKCLWRCLVRNIKKWHHEELTLATTVDEKPIELKASLIESDANGAIVAFEWSGHQCTFADILKAVGELPIPPYLKRKSEESDLINYQTVYSKIEGSVAAPTAGLHFTTADLEKLTQAGVTFSEVTLHVGAGTFKPVKSDAIGQHHMHSEYVLVSKRTVELLLTKLNHIIAVGTTSMRTLESLYHIGVMLHNNPNLSSFRVEQWQPYSQHANAISVSQSLQNILSWLEKAQQDFINFHTQILIAPGYKFQVVNGLITNFHQPRSTLLLLVSAFVGEDWQRVYQYALDNHFRFLSYGDSSILFRT